MVAIRLDVYFNSKSSLCCTNSLFRDWEDVCVCVCITYEFGRPIGMHVVACHWSVLAGIRIKWHSAIWMDILSGHFVLCPCMFDVIVWTWKRVRHPCDNEKVPIFEYTSWRFGFSWVTLESSSLTCGAKYFLHLETSKCEMINRTRVSFSKRILFSSHNNNSIHNTPISIVFM